MPLHLRTPTPLKTPRGFILNPCFDLLPADPELSTIGSKRSCVSSRRFSSSLRSKLTRNTAATAERLLEAFNVPRDVAPRQAFRDAVAAVALVSFDQRLEENLRELMEDLFNPIVYSTGAAGSRSKQGFRMKPRGVFKGVGVRK